MAGCRVQARALNGIDVRVIPFACTRRRVRDCRTRVIGVYEMSLSSARVPDHAAASPRISAQATLRDATVSAATEVVEEG